MGETRKVQLDFGQKGKGWGVKVEKLLNFIDTTEEKLKCWWGLIDVLKMKR